MLALSIKQPWSHLILTGVKTVENRTWRTAHRGDLVIHAAGSRDRLDAILPPGVEGPREEDMAFGALIGLVEVVDVLPVEECHGPWAKGPWCWILRNPRPYRRPRRRKGSPRLFRVP